MHCQVPSSNTPGLLTHFKYLCKLKIELCVYVNHPHHLTNCSKGRHDMHNISILPFFCPLVSLATFAYSWRAFVQLSKTKKPTNFMTECDINFRSHRSVHHSAFGQLSLNTKLVILNRGINICNPSVSGSCSCVVYHIALWNSKWAGLLPYNSNTGIASTTAKKTDPHPFAEVNEHVFSTVWKESHCFGNAVYSYCKISVRDNL